MNLTPKLSDDDFEELNYRLEAVEAQRNRALADAAIAYGKQSIASAKLDRALKDIEKFKADVEELNAKLAALVVFQET